MQSELSRATLEHPLYSQEGPDPTPPRTARSTRSTGSAMRASQAQHAREMAAAERHAARMSTSRHSGQYRSSGGGAATSSTAAAHSGSPGGNTLSNMITKGFTKVSNLVHPSGTTTSRSVLTDRGLCSAGCQQGSPSRSDAPGAKSLPAAHAVVRRHACSVRPCQAVKKGKLHPDSMQFFVSCRARDVVDKVPQTSRVSGVVKTNRLSEISHIPSFSTSTSRQGGVYGGSKHTSGAVTARPAATGRPGSRWK